MPVSTIATLSDPNSASLTSSYYWLKQSVASRYLASSRAPSVPEGGQLHLEQSSSSDVGAQASSNPEKSAASRISLARAPANDIDTKVTNSAVAESTTFADVLARAIQLVGERQLTQSPNNLTIAANTVSLAKADTTIFLDSVVTQSTTTGSLPAQSVSNQANLPVDAAKPAAVVTPSQQTVATQLTVVAPIPMPPSMITTNQAAPTAIGAIDTSAQDDMLAAALLQASLNADLSNNSQMASNRQDFSYLAAPFFTGLMADRGTYGRPNTNYPRSSTIVPPIKPIVGIEPMTDGV